MRASRGSVDAVCLYAESVQTSPSPRRRHTVGRVQNERLKQHNSRLEVTRRTVSRLGWCCSTGEMVLTVRGRIWVHEVEKLSVFPASLAANLPPGRASRP